MSNHHCHAHNCHVRVPPKMFMCARHWRMLPREAQDDIWNNYVPGQERRKDPTNEYMKAAQRARAIVFQKETGVPIEVATNFTRTDNP